MSREISLFSDFHQGENRVTNYCGLMLKIVYQEKPEAFQEVISTLIAETGALFEILPSFKQQQAKNINKNHRSIPDLTLKQKSFNIYFETKITDWFYESQITNHIENLFLECDDSANKIMFLLTSEYTADVYDKLKGSIEYAKSKGIIFSLITFKDLLDAIKSATVEYSPNNDYLRTMVLEFEEYLSVSNLLPRWKNTLDIVNCGGTKDEIANGVYICPNTSGAYNHRRAKYFGAYWNKQVNYISYIKAVVLISDSGKTFNVKWKLDNNFNDKDLEREAAKKLLNCQEWRREEAERIDLQMFLLDELTEVEFKKQSKGGMMNSKIYRFVEAENIEALKEELQTTIWE